MTDQASETSRPLRVLVVDDEPTLLRSITAVALLVGGMVIRPLLARGGGAILIDVGDFLALADDDDELPDLVVCDYDMGSMTGVQVIETLRPHYPSVAFAIWSGLDRGPLPEGVRFILKDQHAFDGIVAAARAAAHLGSYPPPGTPT